MKTCLHKALLYLMILGCLLISLSAHSIDVLEIERMAALEAICSISKPCGITVTVKEDKYIAKVTKSSFISPQGVLRYKSGSITYYIYNLEGVLLDIRKTT